ncbi:hypothetical protein LINPERHAP2_LOCUS43141 [Linum perenne]
MERLELAEGESHGSLRIHPSHHRHRHELRAQASALPATQPCLISNNPCNLSVSTALLDFRYCSLNSEKLLCSYCKTSVVLISNC